MESPLFTQFSQGCVLLHFNLDFRQLHLVRTVRLYLFCARSMVLTFGFCMVHMIVAPCSASSPPYNRQHVVRGHYWMQQMEELVSWR